VDISREELKGYDKDLSSEEDNRGDGIVADRTVTSGN
jgi:hypothetical protein